MNQYTEKELRDILGQNMEVPEEVNDRLRNVYKQIRENKIEEHSHKSSIFKRRYMTLAVAAAAVVGTLTVCAAAYYNWNTGLTEQLRINEEQQKTLEDSGMAVFSGVSCTDAGVTVTAQQSITDNYYTYLSFKVEGYDLAEGAEPSFESISITVDGESVSWGGGFYDGLIQGPDGLVVYADGSPIDYEDENLVLGKYVMEDGSLEYHAVLAKSDEKGFFVGKPIHVEIENIGTAGKAEHISDLDGKWVLDWNLGGADTSQTYLPEENLGDTETVIKQVELSPVSIKVLYDFPRKEVTEEVYLEDGTIETYTGFEEAPWPAGVKLKDGTLLNALYGGPGSEGYTDSTSTEYTVSYAFDRVIDVNEVEAVLFVKSYPEGEEKATEENYYVVPLGD
ncbi:MAG: DUF4179 domain-containing protein [Muricoprocola sp.]